MKKILIILIISFIFLPSKSYALFGLKSLIKTELSAVKGEIDEIKTMIKLNAELSNKIVGIDKSINQQAGRDNISIVNDPKILYSVISVLGTVIAGLIGIIKMYINRNTRIMTRLLEIEVKKKEYKTKYYKIKNGNHKIK